MPEVARPVRVVIVDDTRTIRAMIRARLSAAPQIEVVGEAADPYEAREVIRALNPDVITLDVVMPRMDGFDFMTAYNKLEDRQTAGHVVVMLTTSASEDDAERASQFPSLKAFVPKPLTAEALHEILHDHF